MQKWKKLGRIFAPDKLPKNEHLFSYAMLPTPVYRGKGKVRIYFSPRSKKNQGVITYLDYDLNTKQTFFPERVLLTPGELGHFDDEGCLIGTVIEDKMYYLGWNNAVSVPFRNTIGMAQKTEKGWKKLPGPILGRSPNAPIGMTVPFVWKKSDSWELFSGKIYKWEKMDNGKLTYITVLSKARSYDGINWEWEEENIIKTNLALMEKIVRPWIVKIDNQYHMWFSVRILDEPYRLGYAFSKDGIHWERRDEEMDFFNNLPREDWEKEMLCYPTVFQTEKGEIYMLYNGNGFGKTGFGLAKLEQ